MYELDAALDVFRELEQRIRASDPIAQKETIIEVVLHRKSLRFDI